jgi:peptidoglycan hydrolase CwlO-like protein
MRVFAVAVILLLFIPACGAGDKEIKLLQEELKALREENSFLKAEIAGLKKEVEEVYRKLDEKDKSIEGMKEERRATQEASKKMPQKADPQKKKPTSR